MRSGRAGRAARRSAAARAIQTAARLYLARLAQHDAARVLVSLFRRNHGWVLREKWRALVDWSAPIARGAKSLRSANSTAARSAQAGLESVRRVAKSAGWEPPQRAPKLSRRERAIAVLLFKTGGFPKDAEGWSRWYSELRLRDGDARGERDCSAVRRQVKALAQARKLADVEALAVLDKPTLLRFGFESHAQLGVSACASARADGKGSGSPAVRFQAHAVLARTTGPSQSAALARARNADAHLTGCRVPGLVRARAGEGAGVGGGAGKGGGRGWGRGWCRSSPSQPARASGPELLHEPAARLHVSTYARPVRAHRAVRGDRARSAATHAGPSPCRRRSARRARARLQRGAVLGDVVLHVHLRRGLARERDAQRRERAVRDELRELGLVQVVLVALPAAEVEPHVARAGRARRPPRSSPAGKRGTARCRCLVPP